MIWIEVTTDVTHQVDKDYPCVRIHFFQSDRHFWVKNEQTPIGISFCNAILTDHEILDIIDKRWQVVEIQQKRHDSKALDFLYDLSQLALKHGWDLKSRMPKIRTTTV